jgi:hypothetical protein
MRSHTAVFESGELSSFDRGFERFQRISDFLNLAQNQLILSRREVRGP